jgi:hypothetical protein
MKSRKIIWILILSIIGLSHYRCKPEEIILHGEINGIVTDAITDEPVTGALVKLNPLNDTILTRSDGTFLFKNVIPGNYEIQVSKDNYHLSSQYVVVTAAKTIEISFTLNEFPSLKYSWKALDFKEDLTLLNFLISRIGIGEIGYFFIPRKD